MRNLGSNCWVIIKRYFTLGLPWLLRWQSVCLWCGRPGFDPWVGKIPWRRKWQPTPVFLPGKSHGWRSLAGYSSWGHKESDTTKWFHFLSLYFAGKVLCWGYREYKFSTKLHGVAPLASLSFCLDIFMLIIFVTFHNIWSWKGSDARGLNLEATVACLCCKTNNFINKVLQYLLIICSWLDLSEECCIQVPH